MAIIFRAFRTNFNAKRDVKVTLEAVDQAYDKQQLSQILNVPEAEVLYVQILCESEVPDESRGAWAPRPLAEPES
jgi:hypothetical protein